MNVRDALLAASGLLGGNSGGGGGGGEAVLVNKTVSANGTYLPSADNADGYKKVVVNVPVPTPTLITKTITANGTYAASDDNADGYSSVTVDVQGSGGSIPGVSFIQQITLSENTRAVQLEVPSGYDWVYLFVNGAFAQENWVYTDINGSSIGAYSPKISTIRLGWSFAITADGVKLYCFVPNATGSVSMSSTSATLPFNTIRVRGYSADFVAGTKLLMFGGKYADM